MSLFSSHFHDSFAAVALGYIPYGGADYGEIAAIARQTGAGDDDAYYAAWVEAAQRLESLADSLLAQGHNDGARQYYLRASNAYRWSYVPLLGAPVDERLRAAFDRQMALFAEAMDLRTPPGRPLAISCEGKQLPGYFLPAEGYARECRPLLILTNGYEGTLTDLYFASAVAATRRGYHVLMFDGPGQGAPLIRDGLPLRPDWEVVIRAVVDAALGIEQVDATRIALSGWSLGGYLALRGASGEPRLAACVADPGMMSMTSGLHKVALRWGVPLEALNDLGALDETTLARITPHIQRERRTRWSVVQRGFWANGVDNLRDYLAEISHFTLDGRIGEIRCPTLLTRAELDPLADGAESLFAQLRCPKLLLHFRADEGAGDHCEVGNRSLLNQRVLDWLDDVLAAPSGRQQPKPSLAV